jgi:hypothetical protein
MYSGKMIKYCAARSQGKCKPVGDNCVAVEKDSASGSTDMLAQFSSMCSRFDGRMIKLCPNTMCIAKEEKCLLNKEAPIPNTGGESPFKQICSKYSDAMIKLCPSAMC